MAFKWNRPRGALTLSLPAWHMDDVAVAAWGQTESGLLFDYISLYNNDTLGRSLVVWAIVAGTNFANYTLFYSIKGTFGSKVADPVALNPTRGMPPGEIWLNKLAAAISDPPIIAAGTFVPELYPSTFPITIVPPGYSFTVGPDVVSDFPFATFWYVPTPGV